MAVISSRHVTVIYVCHLNFKVLYFKLIRIASFHYLYARKCSSKYLPIVIPFEIGRNISAQCDLFFFYVTLETTCSQPGSKQW